MLQGRAWALLLFLGCSSPKAMAPDHEADDPDIVRPPPGGPTLQKIPGPMLGPFNSYSSALIAACSKIVTKPHATAGRKDHPQFDVRWRVSSEYCAWMYYTPDEKYVISKLTDQTLEDPALRGKHCFLPSTVEDQRYPPGSIKYVFALHNHLYEDRISDDDITYIVSEAGRHSISVDTKDGRLWISIVAFFANDFENPVCDGFYQYIAATNQILKWTHAQGRWVCEQTHLVEWPKDLAKPFVKETSAPCVENNEP